MEHKYFVKLERFSPGAKPLFVGPVGKEEEAVKMIEKAITTGSEIVTGDNQPSNIKNAIHAQILTKTEARKSGLRAKVYGDKKDNVIENIPAPSEWDTILEKIISEKEKSVTKPIVTEASESKDLTEKSKHQKTAIENKLAVTGEEVIEKIRETLGIVIVSKYPGTIDWLKSKGFEGNIVDKIYNPSQIKDKLVIGVLPLRLAKFAKKIGNIDIPGLRADQRGVPLTPEQMEKAGAHIRWYEVKEIEE
jgi:putative CRISPR-associated protein (TIGR02620 family)